VAPTPQQVTAAIKALNDEAATWSTSAHTMRTAAAAAGWLSLGEGELSWASRPTGLVDTYALVQQKVNTLLGEGADTFDALSKAIATAAAGYQKDEDNAVHRTRNVW